MSHEDCTCEACLGSDKLINELMEIVKRIDSLCDHFNKFPHSYKSHKGQVVAYLIGQTLMPDE